MSWVIAGLAGVLGVAALFGLAWLRGISPRRLVWPDLARVRPPDADEREILLSNIQTSLRLYLPMLLAALGLGGLLVIGGEPMGLTLLICFGVPPVLAVVRTLRVLRYLKFS